VAVAGLLAQIPWVAGTGLDSPGLRWPVVAASGVATLLAGVRWLRVAQREHYLPDSASRFALRWWRSSTLNLVGIVVAVGAMVASGRWPATAVVCAVVVAVGPVGLGLRGRSAPLAWTRRMKTLGVVWLVLQGGVFAAGIAFGEAPAVAAAGALAVPAVVDLACALTAPLERRLVAPFVARARARLEKVSPMVVAITGSYGKTSTKGYVAHLAAGSRSVLSSPASFNNRAGLARAVNEHLSEGTDVFVAEMGTYGKGEIAELCRWLTPDVAVITAIGPVHLERFRSESRIVEAKAEIVGRARCAVLAVDDERLAALADRCEAAGTRVRRVSVTDRGADVCVHGGPSGLTVLVDGEVLASAVAVDARPGNVGAAVAAALELGVPLAEVAARLPTLPTAAHRLEPSVAPSGAVVLDDTYNANPAGARVALDALAAHGGGNGRLVVVTPGMVELGPRQAEENARFGAQAAAVATDVVVVGRTNRRALLHGLALGSAAARTVARREQAVSWVREHLGAGDAVLYENDLPDHYP
jgi:UDP-N-acetylmuramoyl-tripeptide--D-alanyl-D-alanine ligase